MYINGIMSFLKTVLNINKKGIEEMHIYLIKFVSID